MEYTNIVPYSGSVTTNFNQLHTLYERIKNELPYDVICYIYEFRPLTRIEVWYDKYYYKYPFMQHIFNRYDNGETYDNPGSEYVYDIFTRIFPHIELHSRIMSITKTKHYKNGCKYIGSTYTSESHIDFNTLEAEIFEKMDHLIKNKKNHWNLYKLHLTFLVLNNILVRYQI